MIEYINGRIADLTPTTAVIENAAGTAYLLNITLPTFSALQSERNAKLLVHESIRDDAWVLYGFLEERERTLFRELIGVSGVGAGTARIILSSITAAELESVISSGDEKRLKAVKGVGQKTAQRIIVDLKGKIDLSASTAAEAPAAADTPAFDEAMTALTVLGFQRQAINKALKKIFDSEPTTNVETAIRKALAML